MQVTKRWGKEGELDEADEGFGERRGGNEA